MKRIETQVVELFRSLVLSDNQINRLLDLNNRVYVLMNCLLIGNYQSMVMDSLVGACFPFEFDKRRDFIDGVDHCRGFIFFQ